MITFNIYKLLLYAAGIVILFRLMYIKINQHRLLWSLAGVGFILNLIWEMAQMPLYTGYIHFADHIVCIPASVGDVLAVLALYAIVSFVKKDWYWLRNIEKETVALSMILGSMLAIIMEQRALLSGMWTYTSGMPLVPFFRVGLLPVLQMTILPLITYAISNKITKNSKLKL